MAMSTRVPGFRLDGVCVTGVHFGDGFATGAVRFPPLGSLKRSFILATLTRSGVSITDRVLGFAMSSWGVTSEASTGVSKTGSGVFETVRGDGGLAEPRTRRGDGGLDAAGFVVVRFALLDTVA